MFSNACWKPIGKRFGDESRIVPHKSAGKIWKAIFLLHPVKETRWRLQPERFLDPVYELLNADWGVENKATEAEPYCSSEEQKHDKDHNGLLEYFQFEAVSLVNNPFCVEMPKHHEDDYKWKTPSPWDTQENSQSTSQNAKENEDFRNKLWSNAPWKVIYPNLL